MSEKSTSYTIEPDRENDFIRVTLLGVFRRQEGEEVITKARQKAAETGKNLLYDMRQAVTDVMFFEWFEMPRTLEVFQESKTRRVKAALVISPDDNIEDYQFYETVLFNLGITFKVFLEEPQAVQWLKNIS